MPQKLKINSEAPKAQLSPAVVIRRLAAGVLLLNIFVIALAGLSLRQSRLQYEERAAVTTQNLALVLDKHISGIIGKIDVLLFSAVEEFEREISRGGGDRRQLNSLLARMVSQMPELDRLTVVNTRGEITYGTGVGVKALKNVSDRDYFRQLRDNPNLGLYISKPLVSRIDGRWVLILARRIKLADGSFAGTIAGVVSLEYFQKLFAPIEVGPHGAIVLRYADLSGIVRFPESKVAGSFVGQNKVSSDITELLRKGKTVGTLKTTPPIDKIERLYTFRKLTNYPLHIVVGLASEDYLAQWWSEVVRMSSAATFFFLFTLVMALLIFRDWKLRTAAVQELILTRVCLDNAAIGIFNVSEDGTIMSVNDYACQSLGYSREELGAMKYWHVSPIVNVEKASEIKRTLDTFGYGTHEMIHRRKDGSLFPVEMTATIVFFNGMKYYFSIMKDITERKLTEQALRDTQFSVDHAAFPIFWIGADSRFCYTNEACGYLGYSRDELLQMTAYDIDPLITREGVAKLAETLREKGSETFESLHRTRNGDLIPVEITLNNLEHAGKVFHVAYVRDISERKAAQARIVRSEQKFRAIFESAHDAIFLIAADSAYVDCNPAASELFSCSKEAILAGNPQCFSPPLQSGGFNTMDKAREIIDDALQGKPQCFEWRHRRPDGSEFDSTVVLSRFDLDGEPMLVAIVRDISQRKSLEEQLHQAQKMEAVGQLAGGVAHDFNNILTGILGFTYLVSREIPEDAPSAKYVEQIQAAAERAAELTLGLLSFSRKEVMTPKSHDLNDIVFRLENMLRRLIRSSIDLRAELSLDVLNVMADRGKLEQVIMNLVTNARDSIRDDGIIIISTSTCMVDEQFLQQHGLGKTGKYACICVRDSGCGMSEETRLKIFEPFFTTKASGKGTGLGLSIVYGIIQQHEGFITVNSEQGNGTTFNIFLPLADIPAVTGHLTQSGTATTLLGNETLLLAEDDSMVNNLHKVLLEEAGYKVITAADGNEALSRFLECQDEIALLILDTVMPKMSGKDLFEAISIVNPGIKALFVSGYPAEVLRNADMVREDAEIMFKPLSPNDLLNKVREILDC